MKPKIRALLMVPVLVLLCASIAVAGNVVDYTYDGDGNIGDAVISAQTPTVHISADPETIQEGASSTLSWFSADADSCTIDQGIGTVDLNGSTMVSPTVTTTYTITATGPGGTSTDSVTVTVAPPPTVSISADPENIQSGESSTLTWSSTDADSCEIQPDVGTVGTSGSINVSPTETTTYTITATGPGGTASDSVTVSVLSVTEWKSPGLVENVTRSGSNGVFSNPSNAAASDDAYAACTTLRNGQYSDWLRSSNFGFTDEDIPAGSIIDGIEVQIERHATAQLPNWWIKDDALYLRKASGQVGDNKADTVNSWPTSDAYASYGGAADIWNTGLVQSDIVTTDFGCDISVLHGVYNTDAYIDHVRIRVYYYRE
jgi:hypothetical protein